VETRTDLDTLAAWVRDRQEQMQGAIRELAGIESPSDDAPAVNRAVAWVQARGTAIGGEAKLHRNLQDSGIKYGHVLELKFHPRDPIESQKPVLLLGHLDTVWAEGTLASMPIRTENGRMFGPGVYDMKAGVVMALTAVQALIETSLLNQPVSLLLVSDEEVGSPVSRPITEKVAGQASAVFVVEPAQGPQGAYKTARKGVGGYRLEVRGIGAHSGVDFTAGHSAVLELARQIEVISGFTDLDSGLTVNPGVIGGGTRSNVVAESAWVEIDVRVARIADVEGIERKLRGLRPFDEKCVLTLTGGLNRPPMERTKGTAALFERAATLAGYMGCKLEEAATGGGSDGNFTSALGIPTLDGMGAVGEGAHASNESILIDALVPRTALLAAMLLNDMGLR
jgi:glutamate carboxypeptidase